ncbi:hypothetical protein HDU85_003494 [Gaertneriomyces sp. JEL0708]|nr:hypothetical protein HDU85_003494 [Gaertneriomyces sp. JEL0708]
MPLLDQPRYDQSTYWGRLRHFMQITDPRNLLATESELAAAKDLVERYKDGKINAAPEALWKAKTLIDSTYHPDTGEKVILPFRMSSFVPTNVLIVAGMLVPNPSIGTILFWQWVNQSVNVAFNYFNANKTTEMSMTETTTAYLTAVGSSCTIAVGLNEWVKRVKSLSPSTRAVLARAVPFAAVAAAGTLNVFLMRQKELREGILIQDNDGNPLGKSTTAGYKAVGQVAISRVATAFPVVFVPGLIMAKLERTTFWKQHPRWRVPLNLATITGSLLAALPCAVALFPQRASMPVSLLEPQFYSLKAVDGSPIRTVYFNRGL